MGYENSMTRQSTPLTTTHTHTPTLTFTHPNPPHPTVTFSTIIRILLCISILLPIMLSLFMPSSLSSTLLDTCYVDRFGLNENLVNPSKKKNHIYELPFIGMLITLFTTAALKLSGAGSSLHTHHVSYKSKRLRSYRWRYIGIVLLAYMWYLNAYFLCSTLKSILSDYRCNRHSNSVSGHYLFFVYMSFTLFHLHIHQVGLLDASLASYRTWKKLLFATTETIFFTVSYTLFLAFSLYIMYNTYIGGYHTIRQILYGIALAFFYQYILVEVIEFIDWLDQPMTMVMDEDTDENENAKNTATMQRQSKHMNGTGSIRNRNSNNSRKSSPTISPSNDHNNNSNTYQTQTQTHNDTSLPSSHKNANHSTAHNDSNHSISIERLGNKGDSCIIHISNDSESMSMRGGLQRLLYYAATWQIQSQTHQHNDDNDVGNSNQNDSNTLNDQRIHRQTENYQQYCGTVLAYNAWSIVIIFIIITTFLVFMFLNLTSKSYAFTGADVVACVIGWCILIFLHITHRLTARDQCTEHHTYHPFINGRREMNMNSNFQSSSPAAMPVRQSMQPVTS